MRSRTPPPRSRMRLRSSDVASTSPGPESPGNGRRALPFWVHQALEYALGVILVEAAFHVRGTMTPIMIGIAASYIALAALSHGPLGALRVLGRGVHRVIDVVLLALVALSPLLALHHMDLVGVAMVELSALVLARLVWSTRYADPPRQGAPSGLAGHLARAGGSTAGPAAVSDRGSPRPAFRAVPSGSPARPPVSMARLAGFATARRARNRAPELEARRAERTRLLRVGARRLGAGVGRASERRRTG